jgi:hypothetical protein
VVLDEVVVTMVALQVGAVVVETEAGGVVALTTAEEASTAVEAVVGEVVTVEVVEVEDVVDRHKYTRKATHPQPFHPTSDANCGLQKKR